MNSNVIRFKHAAADAMRSFLMTVLPGASPAMVRLRAQIYEFACDPLADRLLLEGPYGSGKSALARLVGFLKWVAFFFFQAEDGIRDGRVTGVQTCALPI